MEDVSGMRKVSHRSDAAERKKSGQIVQRHPSAWKAKLFMYLQQLFQTMLEEQMTHPPMRGPRVGPHTALIPQTPIP